jgi:oligopeptide/dipeptide ABC transporter ATP-binding protein
VVIARALAVEPSVLVLDEPTSSLDVSVKALIVNQLLDLQRTLDLSYLLITHEIDIARHMTDEIAVMYLGHLVESGEVPDEHSFRHPYAQLLIGSHAPPDPGRETTPVRIKGEIPSAVNPPAGCRFHTRCPIVIDRCRTELPALLPVGAGHFAACHRADEKIDVAAGTASGTAAGTAGGSEA